MAGFLLISEKATNFNSTEAINLMARQCPFAINTYSLPGFKLHIFNKNIAGYANQIQCDHNSLFFTGFPIAGGKLLTGEYSYTPGNNPDGLYFILSLKDKKLRFTTDTLGLYNFYHNSEGTVLSSSFLALCAGLPMLTPSKDVLSENLLTGSVIGPDTLFREIFRFEVSSPFSLPDLEFDPPGRPKQYLQRHSSKKESMLFQIEILDSWFSSIKPLVSQFGLSSGITGGLDSRLLLAMCRRHFRPGDMVFHSHQRPVADKDFLLGKEVCSTTQLKFESVPVKGIEEKDEEETEATLDKAMLFCDGQIRTHAFWFEDFNTADYVSSVTGNRGILFNGIGGEQYRNMGRMIISGPIFDKWIEHKLVMEMSGDTAAGLPTRRHLVARLSEKIAAKIGRPAENRIDLLYVKQYLNEVYNPANRLQRANNENKYLLSVSPFADPAISTYAYKSVPYLGYSLEYEAGLIRLIDAKAASVMSNYGFRFTHREPLLTWLPKAAFNNLLPAAIQQRLIKRMTIGSTLYWKMLLTTNQVLASCVDMVRSFNLPVNVDELLKRTDVGPLVFATGHLLKRFNEKINRDDF